MVRLGISIGDINGIGLEVILKTFSDERIFNYCTPVVYGSAKVLSYHKNIVKDCNVNFHTISEPAQAAEGKFNLINCWNDMANIELGKLTEESGKFAVISLDKMTRDLMEGHLDAVVTAPVNKKALDLAQFPYTGHTEYFQDVFGGESLMTLVHDELRVSLVTNHLPISEVSEKIKKELILKKLEALDMTLKMDFGIEKPTIAVMGLNPHSGDDGAIGKEEEEEIRPAVEEAKSNGIMAFGPYPADGFFGSAQFNKFDGILAMYHDQGLVPFKTLAFGGGVNFTAGLPAIRTSPDHGTAFDIAGKGVADATSFRKAVYLALDVFKSRADWNEMMKTPLKKKPKPSEEIQE
jgi:4-hydroxythreonine-4-phosphate dehydrogenase